MASQAKLQNEKHWSEEKKYLICGKLKLCSKRYPNIDNSHSSVNVMPWHLLCGLKVMSNAVKVNYFPSESESGNLDISRENESESGDM